MAADTAVFTGDIHNHASRSRFAHCNTSVSACSKVSAQVPRRSAHRLSLLSFQMSSPALTPTKY
jgi:hypothetical protein